VSRNPHFCWGLKLAEREGKSGKKRAVIAVARKLAVLLHRLWVSGEVDAPLSEVHQEPRNKNAAQHLSGDLVELFATTAATSSVASRSGHRALSVGCRVLYGTALDAGRHATTGE